MGRKEDCLGTRPSLSAFRHLFITPITDGNAWTANELALLLASLIPIPANCSQQTVGSRILSLS
jgi:hypothetical protein